MGHGVIMARPAVDGVYVAIMRDERAFACAMEYMT
jgi:hypothetical protein